MVEINLSCGKAHNPSEEIAGAFVASKRSIDAVVYKFDDIDIYNALETAIRNGVVVRIVFDKTLVKKDEKGFIRKLAKQRKGVSVRKWPRKKMHAKFAVIDSRCVLSGSYNWSESAKKKNTELVLRFEDAESVVRFGNLFEKLWKNAEEL